VTGKGVRRGDLFLPQGVQAYPGEFLAKFVHFGVLLAAGTSAPLSRVVNQLLIIVGHPFLTLRGSADPTDPAPLPPLSLHAF